jgi:hypothetical protein
VTRKALRTIALIRFALVLVLAAPSQAQTKAGKEPYPGMAPLDQYLMERKAEIALTRSAPEPVSRMPRSWSSDDMTTRPWSKARTVSCAWWNDHGTSADSTIPGFGLQNSGGPICFNAAAVRSYLAQTIRKPN